MWHEIFAGIRDIMVALTIGYIKLRLDAIRQKQQEHEWQIRRNSERRYSSAGAPEDGTNRQHRVPDRRGHGIHGKELAAGPQHQKPAGDNDS